MITAVVRREGWGKYHLSNHIGQESELDNVNLSDFMRSYSDCSLAKSGPKRLIRLNGKAAENQDVPEKCQSVMAFCSFCDNLKLLDVY